MLLPVLPLPHVLLALLKQVHSQAIGKVLLVGSQVAVSIVEGVHAVALALGLLILPHVVGAVSALLHAYAIPHTVRPRALVKIAVVVPTHTVPAAVPC